LVVAVMGAILLAGIGLAPERGRVRIDLALTPAIPAGIAVAESFRFVFVAALLVSVLALLAVVLLEERTLHGPAAAPDERRPRSPEAVPAE